jgi:Mg-chelatase subunit ChlI
VRGLEDPRQRMMILQRHIAFEEDAERFRGEWLPREQELSQRIARAREIVDKVDYTSRDLFTIANLTSSLRIDGHRADLVILKTARAHAAFEGRRRVSERDILLATELAIPHRLRRGPFQDVHMSMSELEERVEQISSEWEGEEVEPDTSAEATPIKKKVSP